MTISGNNTTNRAEWVPVKAKAANGFYVTVHVYVEPKFIDPPKFTSDPVVGPPCEWQGCGAAMRWIWAAGKTSR